MAKRKQNYPPPKSNRRPPPPGSPESIERPNLAAINLNAGAGQSGLAVGDRVRIGGNGLYGGEVAVIERLSSGAIPSALVRVESGGSRQVRTIDLEPVKPEPKGATTGSTTLEPSPELSPE